MAVPRLGSHADGVLFRVKRAVQYYQSQSWREVGSDVPLVLFGGWIELELPLLHPECLVCVTRRWSGESMPYVGWYLSGPSTVIHLCAKYVIPMWRKWNFFQGL
jgi:hypothetical protein